MTKFSLLFRGWQLKLVGSVAIIGALSGGVSDRVNAQIVPDNTLGAEGSVVTPNVNIQGISSDRIDGGATRGANLFHSFQEFNVGEGRGAYFANPTGIENILTRVTGNNPSNILGRLGVLGEANLFLLNPHGIVFGPNASLDIHGSFVATTAERIQLGDSGYFSAAEPQTSNLLSVSPGALFFSQVANQPTAIINQGNLSTGKNLTLRAGNLDLQGQLLAGGDLTLQAQDTVKVRDTIASPFIATSGRNLTIQGNQNVDILALSHPQSSIQSGGNLNLVSDGDISGDAHFFSGGSLSMLTLSGTPGNFVSKFDPIIEANGDVLFGNYTGVALKVEATGSIRGGNIKITGAECAAGSVGCVGGIPTTDPDFATLTGRPSVILRAGLTAVNRPNVSQNAGGTGFTASSGLPLGITVGNINTSSSIGGNGGDIILSAAKSSISTGSLDSHSYSNSGNGKNGGAITLTAANNINITGNLFSYSYSSNAAQGGAISLTAGNDINITSPSLISGSYSGSGNAAQGGAISLTAANDINITSNLDSESSSSVGNAAQGGAISLTAGNDIVTGNLISSSSSFSNPGNAAQGGAIGLTAANGSITAGNLNSSSYSDSGNAGQGGAIALTAANDINITGNLNSFSYSPSGTASQGGAISLIAKGGDITGRGNQSTVLGSFSISEQGRAGNGGDVTLKAKNNVSNLEILTLSSDSKSGAVQVRGLGDLLLTNTNILTSKQVTVPVPLGTGEPITLNVGGKGQSGNVDVTSLGNLTFNNSSIQSDTKGSDQAGNVTVSSPGRVTFNNSFIRSNTSNTGAAGSIGIEADQGITLIGSDSQLSARTTNQGKAGDITLTTPQLTLQNGANIATTTASSSPAGNIILQSHPNTENLNINLAPGTSISASTSNQGTGGNIEIKAPNAVMIQGQSTITTETTGAGNAGKIEVTSRNLDIQQTELSTSTTNSGNAGDITLDTSTLTVARGAKVFARTNGPGNSGTITANASTSMSLGIGVEDFSPVLSVETSSAGQPGSIIINTPSLRLSNTARITATATNTATNSLGDGSITINASTMDLAGVVGVFAETQGQTPAGTLTLKPYQNQSTLNLTLAPQSLVSASTTGSGKGGNLIVQAPSAITIQGPGQLAVQTTGDGAAGDLRIDTQRLTIADGATISASTSSKNPEGTGGSIIINATESFNLTNQASLLAQSTGAAKAGNVTINTEQLTADNGSITTSATATSLGEGGSIDVNASQINLKGTEIGLLAETQGVAPAGALTLQPFANGQNLTINLQDNAKISAATSGSGEGGSLSVKAPEAITLRGQGQLSVETTGAGAAGNLSINTQKLTIADGATISASTSSKNPEGVGGNLTINATQSFNLTNQARLLAQSTGAAPAGNITIDTDQLTANNGSIETSATQSAGGGITITASDIRLFGDSDIRTDVASGAGGGGNINLTANSIIAFSDSDILAYAADGKGGDITFKTPIFFGFAYSPAPKGTDPDTLDHNNQVDINATGAVEGVISLPNLSFIQNSLTELPSNQIDTDSLLANSCIVRRNQPTRGSFFITGSSGLPQRPGDAQMSTFPTVDIETLPSDGTASTTNPNRPWQKGDPIVEPQGVYRLPNGKLVISRECSGIQ